MPRPSRRLERRADLVTAARKAIIERGLVDLRLRDIASKAGMSASAVFYYFPAIADLLEEVGRQAVERFCTARAEAVASIADPRRRLVAMIQSGLPSGPDDELCRLLYELGAIARRDPSHAARHIALYERQVAIYVGILEAGAAQGVFHLDGDSMIIARNLVILEDGYGLHAVMAVPTFDKATAERLIRHYAASATRCDLDTLDPADVSTQEAT